MDLNNTKAQMRKGVLEYCILLVIDGKPLYASDIIEELKNSKMIVVEGTLYPLLTRLKNDGLLAYKWEESTQGPPRKYYELTEEGHSCSYSRRAIIIVIVWVVRIGIGNRLDRIV